MPEKILIVEDDIDLLGVLKDLLKDGGYIVEDAQTGSEAIRKVETSSLDLVLLDLGLPDITGESVLAQIRKMNPELPVVILTAKSKAFEIAQGLNLGADDYLAKPFAAEELIARIKARLRNTNIKGTILEAQDLSLNLDTREVKRGDKDIKLTKTEFELLECLMKNKGKVMTREVLLNHVWQYSLEIESRVVDVYVGYLRKKINNGVSPKLIKNIRGVGYLLKE